MFYLFKVKNFGGEAYPGSNFLAKGTGSNTLENITKII